MLVPEDSSEVCIFDNVIPTQNGHFEPLKLASHPGKAVILSGEHK